MTTIDTNSIFNLASDFINQTSRSIFLTGKAGTGKTTFLKHIRDTTAKNTVIVAPTGVAAINASGMTIHSFFQIPPCVFLPGYYPENGNVRVFTKSTLFKNHHISYQKKELFREVELLIIDEVSMVRCDLLDLVDTLLRFARKSQKPFGGVQVLFIGDLFQLPPVAQNEEWSLLKEHYESPFFFHSKAVKEAAPVCIELQKIYRQSDIEFISLLNNVRNNEVTDRDIDLLNSRFSSEAQKVRDHIVLTTHNHKADSINREELEKLDGPLFQFSASIEGDFSEKSFPVEQTVSLKKGARVMFIRNDASEERNYFNGKLAFVKEINKESVVVEFDNGSEFELTKETWQNIRYSYKKETEKIEEEELGKFTQYPIRLAWAITIHKSQGLTFENVIIDAGDSFTAGQVYVALSRCTSLQGLVLSSRITRKQIATNEQVIEHSQQLQREDVAQSLLRQERERYEHQQLIALFEIGKINDELALWADKVPVKKVLAKMDVETLSKNLVEKGLELSAIADKFQKQLEQLLDEAQASGNYESVYDRTQKAIHYFTTFLRTEIYLKLTAHIQSLKGKTKIKNYLLEVKDLANLITKKNEKLKRARLGEKVLYISNGNDEEDTPVVVIRTKKEKGNSALETLKFFKEGKDVSTIATLRDLAESTIEGHLAAYVRTGEIEIERLVQMEKVAIILKALQEWDGNGFSQIKLKLGEDFSYGEIRAVFNYAELLKSSQASADPD
jgi:DNA replication protein DnaC/uncharacterized protein YpbB